MGSLRNPVGPLPSSIYWRRRAVALCLVALLALIAVWAVTSGGGGGGKKTNDAANGSSPAPSITPGPSGTGPAISQQPGGRDESGDSGDADGAGGDGSGDGSGAGDGGTDAGAGGADAGVSGGGKNGDTDGAGGDGGAGSGAGQQVPADSPLPNCTAGALQLSFRSARLAYGPGEKPRFLLTVKNTSAADCKTDLGPKSAVLTVRDTKGVLWSSKDCPAAAAPLFLKVPARATITHTVEWDRGRSAPQCASAPAGEAAPGNYLAEAAVPGLKVSPVAFRLDKD
ncbi:hypothetical protein [Streptomyces sp. NPDC051909]|uniref:hypothetical protein n=1 Tax=Streptomyces sp. NPDC051909 TaxID=3154944 RepID=UPI00343B1A29